MPTTSNFGWTTPADTDLVKDGAAAIRTLGNGVDASLVDLKGGTTGQILSKATNTDLDYTWITPNVGDITEVQAGTGISVASGTGPIPVVTNTVATAYDAKGDLVVGTGADTFAKLTVGTNGYTLVADSAETTGLKWAAAAASGSLTLISTTSMASNSTITLSSIPQTYKHLQLWIVDSYNSNATGQVSVYVNGINNAGSYYGAVFGAGDSTEKRGTMSNNSGWDFTAQFTQLYWANGATDDGFVQLNIYDYTNAVSRKNAHWLMSQMGVDGNMHSMMGIGTTTTNAAITSVSINTNSGTFSGGTIYLYGVL